MCYHAVHSQQATHYHNSKTAGLPLQPLEVLLLLLLHLPCCCLLVRPAEADAHCCLHVLYLPSVQLHLELLPCYH